jgi:SAM-dependent methyltransferase
MRSRSVPAATNADLYGLRVLPLRGTAADPIAVPACIVCSDTASRPRFAVEGVAAPVVVCEKCGLGRFHPMPSAEEVSALYPEEYYGEPGVKFQSLVERLVRIVATRHIAFLSRGLERGARVLDVGCGRGVILAPLADRGFEVHGVEISAEAARGGDSRAHVRIAPRLADAGYTDAYFDEVIVWHVLEHLPDPAGTLAEISRILRPGGRVIVAVPNFESAQARWMGPAWFHLDLPRHLYQFPASGLCTLLEGSGFEVVSEHHFSLRQNPFGWIQSALNCVPGLPRNGLYTVLHERGRGEDPPYSAATRVILWGLLVLLAPAALGATLLSTLARSGATVHVVARRRATSTTTAASSRP